MCTPLRPVISSGLSSFLFIKENRMNVPMMFENHEVEIIEVNGQVLFNPRHVGACLEIEEVTVRRHIQDMSEKHVVKLTNEAIVHLMNIRKLNNAGENFLTESGVYQLVFKSRKPEAAKFIAWITDEVLPSIRKTGSFSVAPKELSHFEQEMLALKYAGEILNLSDVSKLGMMQRLFDIKGFDKAALPAYVGKQRLSASASKLLEDRGKPMSTIAFNQLMVAAGLLEEKERKASHGSVKKFKALTSSGLVYGENLVSPKNDREVQPYYFEDSFDSLLDSIKHIPGDEND